MTGKDFFLIFIFHHYFILFFNKKENKLKEKKKKMMTGKKKKGMHSSFIDSNNFTQFIECRSYILSSTNSLQAGDTEHPGQQSRLCSSHRAKDRS